jgi:acetyltransferase
MLMFGSGGIEVEGLGDVSFALPPLSVAQAERMLDATWAGRRMRGYRNLLPGDRGACIDVLTRLQQIANDFPMLVELEINPLRVFPAGEGVVSLDVRARVALGE